MERGYTGSELVEGEVAQAVHTRGMCVRVRVRAFSLSLSLV